MPAGQWGPHRGFPDRLVPIEYTKPNDDAGGDLYISVAEGIYACLSGCCSIDCTNPEVRPPKFLHGNQRFYTFRRHTRNLRTVAIGTLGHLALQTASESI